MTLLHPGEQITIDGVTVEVDAKVRLKVDGPPAHIVFPNGREMRPPIADLSAAELLERAAEFGACPQLPPRQMFAMPWNGSAGPDKFGLPPVHQGQAGAAQTCLPSVQAHRATRTRIQSAEPPPSSAIRWLIRCVISVVANLQSRAVNRS